MSEKKEVAIKKIVLKVGDKSLELSIEEARELQRVLGELFGQPKEIVKEYVPYYPYRSPTWPYYPYVTWGTSVGNNSDVFNGTVTIQSYSSNTKLLDS